ncbi:MAG TPA: MFS transporter [Alphaproteobacteria bacterium]|jgi:MFS family permease|nr:MFS transporter [Alphaproteobacteria bacterium]
MTPSDSQRRSSYAAFGHRDFTLYWLARFLASVALQMQAVAVGWQVYDLSRDPLDLGLVGLVSFLPAIALVLVTGHVADRFDRRLIIMLCYAVEMLCAAALFLLARHGLHAVWPIFVVLIGLGTARAFASPAVQAFMPNLVPAGDFSSALAWNSTAWQIATIGGPAVGGLLYALGPGAVYGTATAFLAAAAVLMAMMRFRRIKTALEPASWDTLVAGIRFIWSKQIILGAISLDLFAVLFGGATALLPIYARDILEIGPWGLGILRSAPALGAALVAVVLAHRPVTARAGRTLLTAVAVFGVATIVFGASINVWLSLAALAVLGAADMISVFVRQSLVLMRTPDDMRGRVNAVNMVFVGASNEVGEFESGTVAALIGTVASVIVGGVCTIAVAGLWAHWFPALRRVDRLDGDAGG